ncbi:MAG: restriction endonuclease subunit S [Rhodomicrobium sp.]
MLERWESVPLGHIVKFSSGKTKPSRIGDTPDSGKRYPVFGGNGVLGWSDETNADGENIIVGRVGALCGCVHYYSGPCWITDNALYSKEFLTDVDQRFFAYLLEFIDLAKFRAAGGQPLVSQGPIHAHVAPVPRLKGEQRKIAEILRTWDEAIEKISNLIERKEYQTMALTHQLVFGRMRLGNYSSAKQAVRHIWFSLPGDWQVAPIGKLAKEISEGNGDVSAIEVLSCSKYDGFVRSLDYFKKQIFSSDLSGYKKIWRGDFGFPSNHVEEGSIGLQNVTDVGVVSPIYTVFRFDSEQVDNAYAHSVLKTSLYKHIFQISTSASVDRRGSLRWKEFAKIPFPLPPIAEQRAISEVLADNERLIQKLVAERDAFVRQKRGLMQKLLTGEWRVRVGGEAS